MGTGAQMTAVPPVSVIPTVTLVEDEALFRDLLCHALERTGQLRVVGSYGSAQEALAGEGMREADVVLLDIDLGGEDGISLGRQLRARHPALGIVLLSNHAHLAFVRELIAADMTGWAYLLKKSVRDVQTILRAIEGVRAGQVVLDPQLAQGEPGGGRFPQLTARQTELWSLITQGYSNTAIAGRLGLSSKWIENAVGSLYAVLELDTRDPQLNVRVSAALLYAREAGGAHLTVLDDLRE
ncbi:response regulator transcription factor [Deinococcus sp. Arct2-2]|uniref:response regulator transcription factor n=1 Tax=Deinococcus sp. Arct2-2 TaxID=2568653 RepID=UPI0010A2C7D5|nr:response regulator transcription factor [Deinococcus sp. Arct2-2]THF70345.1 response regulator transcription factor [Deinococcus sp. Arct2-2]